MVIDLRKCIGCETCRTACAHVNRVPPNARWRRMAECGFIDSASGKRMFLTMGCMHCAKAPCVESCPTGATRRRPDGIIEIEYDLCMGCGACVVACPYHARGIAHEDLVFRGNGTAEGEDRIGVCTKCNFCLPLIDRALAKGLRPGVEPEATPVCVEHCIADALHFGDLDDPESEVSKMIRENGTARLLEELGTEPAVYYIVK